MELSRKRILKIAVAAVALVFAFIIASINPPEGSPLTDKATLGLAIFAFFIICSLVEVFPEYICWLLMCTCWVLFGCVPFNSAFGFFSNSTWWLIVGAMVLAAAVAKSGLLKRIALSIMVRFPATYKGQVCAIILAGLVTSPMIPTLTVKTTLLSTLTVFVSDSMGFKRMSNGAHGLFAAMWASAGWTICVVLSNSYSNYLMQGLIGADYAPSYIMWFVAALPWFLMMIAFSVFYILTIFRVPKEEIKNISNTKLKDELKSLGKMSREERITALVVAFCLLMWCTELFHKIPSAVIVLLAVGMLCTSNVIDRKAFRGNVLWDSLIFLGCALSMTTALPKMGIDKWVLQLTEPILLPLMSQNFVMFILALALIITIVRFFMVSQTAMAALFMVFLVPAAHNAGIHPWIMSFSMITMANTFILKYQNVGYLPSLFAAQTAAGGEEFVKHKRMAIMCAWYMVLNVFFLIACIPYWKMLGWLP